MAQQFNITQSLFGFAPTDVQRQIDAERQAEALRLSQMSGPQSLVYRGSGIQQRQFADLSKGLLGIEDPRIAEANAIERAKQAALPALQSGGQLAYLDALAGEFERMGLTNQAVQARMLADQQRAAQAEQQSQIALRQAQAQRAMQAPGVNTPANFAAVGSALGIPPKPNLADYTQDEAARINAQIQQNKEKESAAGVAPLPGQLPLEDVVRARNIVEGETKGAKENLGTVGQIRTLLAEAQGGSGTAVAQLRRQLVKLVGDSQIGQGEVRDALGSLGIVGDVVSGINQLFTGTPSKEKLKDVEKVVTALENSVARSYNSSVDRSRILLQQGNLSPQIVENVVPQKYTPASEKGKSKFIEGRTYKDKNDNRAVYKGNGKFEPIQ